MPVNPLAANAAITFARWAAVVRAGAVVRNSVVWPGCEVAASAVLTECIVFSNNPATGIRHGEDC
jgi:ADP-glucose pyrophosphorylase